MLKKLGNDSSQHFGSFALLGLYGPLIPFHRVVMDNFMGS